MSKVSDSIMRRGAMKFYHCFHDEPKDPWRVWLPQMSIEQAHPDDQSRLATYLEEQAAEGMTPDVYYAAASPLWGYGPFVQVIEANSDYVFRGREPGEFILPSDRIDDAEVFFNETIGDEWEIENPGLPKWID